MRALDLAGKKYNRLSVISRDRSFPKGRSRWLCVCECGKQTVVDGYCIRSGNVQSCGCLMVERVRESCITHGQAGKYTRTREYNIWKGIKTRCFNENSTRYDCWGGRGITMCPDWLNSFEKFYADMGPRPSSKHSIERINNDGNYEPSNCKWATQKEQLKNRRKRHDSVGAAS